MLIGKQFTEKLYSTGDEMLDNLLERAFCEGYELAQREYAKKDYEGLTEEGKKILKANRDDYAKQLWKIRNENKNIDKRIVENNWNKVTTSGKIVGGGVKSEFKQSSTQGHDMPNIEDFGKYHKKSLWGNLSKTADDASNIMRKNVEKAGYIQKEKPTGEKIKEKEKALVVIPNKIVKRSGSKTADFLRNNKKALIIGGTGVALAGGGAYLLHRHNKKKKEEEDKRKKSN